MRLQALGAGEWEFHRELVGLSTPEQSSATLQTIRISLNRKGLQEVGFGGHPRSKFPPIFRLIVLH
jgi:hypothetical protein